MIELKYFVIGLIQGLTEFLPISSSGHLVLLSKITQWEDQGLITDIAVHVGTLLAVIIYLRKEIFFLLKKLIQFNLIESNIIFKIALSTIPAIIVGYFIYDFVNLYFRNLQLVAISSIVFAIILYISDRNYENQKEWKGITYKEAFIIGLFQILAFIPGASRAGVTITGARFLGLNRSNAAIFSMLLSIPVILASLTLLLFEISYSEYNYINLQKPLFAASIACITAILAINFMMKLIQSTNFNLFIIYRIIMGFLLLFFYG